MIDTTQGKSLHSKHFVNRSAGFLVLLPAWLLSSCAVFLFSGCARNGPPAQVEDTETSGRITVVAAPEVRGLMGREVQAFMTLYPQARIELVTGGAREGVAALFSQRADLAAVTRELEPEERSVVVKGGMEIEGYRFARDAICVVVHPSNPLENISADDLKRVYLGQITRWNELRGGAGTIEPVIPDPEGDLMAAFVQRVMGGDAPTAPAIRAHGDSEVVAHVRRSRDAIGFVSLAWADSGAKTLNVSSLTGLPYWKADAEWVYKGDYPLTRFCNLYVRSKGPKLANGLITFISSRDGQQIVHEAGLVPTAVPVRFVRRSPMLGMH